MKFEYAIRYVANENLGPCLQDLGAQGWCLCAIERISSVEIPAVLPAEVATSAKLPGRGIWWIAIFVRSQVGTEKAPSTDPSTN